MWEVTRQQYRISALVSQTSFRGETSGKHAKRHEITSPIWIFLTENFIKQCVKIQIGQLWPKCVKDVFSRELHCFKTVIGERHCVILTRKCVLYKWLTFQGLAGGKIIVYPSSNHPSDFKAEENIIVGNVCFYGATAGKVKKTTLKSVWISVIQVSEVNFSV